MTQYIQIISNPASGNYSSAKITQLKAAFEQQGAKVILSHSSESRAFVPAPDATLICVAGGDGTLRWVAEGLIAMAAPPPVFIYPMGTINLIARERDCTRNIETCVTNALKPARYAPAYPAQVNGAAFLACVSVGPDSVAVAAHRAWFKERIGRFAYVIALLEQLFDWPRAKITLTANGREHNCEAFYVAKGRYYAGRWQVAPHARMENPQLHVVALKRARRRDYLWFIISLALNRVAQLSNVFEITTDTLTAHSDSYMAYPVQADGDSITQLPLSISVAARALHLGA